MTLGCRPLSVLQGVTRTTGAQDPLTLFGQRSPSPCPEQGHHPLLVLGPTSKGRQLAAPLVSTLGSACHFQTTLNQYQLSAGLHTRRTGWVQSADHKQAHQMSQGFHSDHFSANKLILSQEYQHLQEGLEMTCGYPPHPLPPGTAECHCDGCVSLHRGGPFPRKCRGCPPALLGEYSSPPSPRALGGPEASPMCSEDTGRGSKRFSGPTLETGMHNEITR